MKKKILSGLRSELAGQKHQYEEQVVALEDSLARTHEQYQGEVRQLETDLQSSQNVNYGTGSALGLIAYKALKRKVR